jgi:EmrB/QacA subfamily drug resistance transporter
VNATQKRWTMLAVVMGSGIVFLDSTVVNVALPKIGEELQSSLIGKFAAENFVYYGYLLSLSALLILAGALNDFFGRRKMFAIGLVGFGATSVLCGLAPNIILLIAFRVLQGAFGAVLVPGSLAIITSSFSGEEQGRAFGVWAGASAATTILGPFVGGILVDAVSWRAVFLINIPLVVLGLYATLRHVPESRDEEATGQFDWLGAAVVFLAVGGLSFGAIIGQQQDWKGAVPYLALAVGAVAAVAFPFLMARSRHPLVPLGLFRSRNFTVTNLSTLVIYGALYVTFAFTTIYLQGTLNYSPAAAGLVGIPGTLFLVLFSTKFGKLAARYGPRLFMAIGPAVMGLGVLWFARIPSTSHAWAFQIRHLSTWRPPGSYAVDLLPGYVVFGIGLMMMVAPLTTALMTSVPAQKSGVASAVNNAISRVGPQLAGALIFVAITTSFYNHVGAKVGQPGSSASLRAQVAPLNPPSSGASAALKAAARSASNNSFHLAMEIGALLLLAGAAVNAIGIRNRTAGGSPGGRPEEGEAGSEAEAPGAAELVHAAHPPTAGTIHLHPHEIRHIPRRTAGPPPDP